MRIVGRRSSGQGSHRVRRVASHVGIENRVAVDTGAVARRIWGIHAPSMTHEDWLWRQWSASAWNRRSRCPTFSMRNGIGRMREMVRRWLCEARRKQGCGRASGVLIAVDFMEAWLRLGRRLKGSDTIVLSIVGVVLRIS